MVAHVLVVDDEQTIRTELCEALVDAGFEALGVGTPDEALAAVQHQSFDVCISDIRMPGMDGIELLQRLGEQSPETMVILITAYGDLDTAVRALRSGATDYVLKPLFFEDILSKVSRLVKQRQMQLELRSLRKMAEQESAQVEDMVGNSEGMQRILALIAKVGPTRSNVLITGPSGTGKELIARAIHMKGEHAEAPFVPINCAAIPETLLEGELFGHKKGAFTGAVNDHEGLLKSAESGTIFLDELGEMPMSIQAKLLRAIESREVQPVGSVRRIPFQARIIAATNKDLQQSIEEGQFREDLYYRMAVMEIPVPPLSERRDDIPSLVRHFVDKYSRELGRSCAGVESSAMRMLVAHEWKGNIRELENAIERALIVAEGELIEPQDLSELVRGAEVAVDEEEVSLAEATRRFEYQHIERAIERCQGDKRRAARRLGVSLSSLYRKLGAGTPQTP